MSTNFIFGRLVIIDSDIDPSLSVAWDADVSIPDNCPVNPNPFHNGASLWRIIHECPAFARLRDYMEDSHNQIRPVSLVKDYILNLPDAIQQGDNKSLFQWIKWWAQFTEDELGENGFFLMR